jgi:hypothetical protein
LDVVDKSYPDDGAAAAAAAAAVLQPLKRMGSDRME